MNTSTGTTATTASITSPMRPSDPLSLFMEDIEKTHTLSGKCVKLQAYIRSLKVDMIRVKDLDVPICKQFLEHAIKTLEVEHDKVLGMVKDILNQTGITDVKVLPEEMIRVFQNPSLAPSNNVLQEPQMQTEQGIEKHGSLPLQMQPGLRQHVSLPKQMQHGSLPVQMQQELGQRGSLPMQMQQELRQHGSVPTQMQQGIGQYGSLQMQMKQGLGQHGSVPTQTQLGLNLGQQSSLQRPRQIQSQLIQQQRMMQLIQAQGLGQQKKD